MTKILFRVLDVESTGLTVPPAEIIEIGFVDLTWDTEARSVEIAAPRSLMFGASKPMTADVIAVHHIRDRLIAGLPLCEERDLRMVTQDESPYAIVAHNLAFEAQWFTPAILGECRAICSYKVALRLWEDAPAHSNAALRYWLDLDLDESLAFPVHRAAPDAFVTASIFAQMLHQTSVKQMVAWTAQPRYLRLCPLGKHRNHPWSAVEHSYLEWILRAPEMDPDVVHAARLELERRREVNA